MVTTQKQYYRPHEIARLYGKSIRTVWRWIRTGKLPHEHDPGGQIVVRVEIVDRSQVISNGN